MHLGDLTDGDISHLVHEFGLHADLSREAVMFPESAAAQSLKHIFAEDPDRAALFRKNARWLEAWLDNPRDEIVSPPLPGFSRAPESFPVLDRTVHRIERALFGSQCWS
ncbi:hypothetical protein [Bradyrhizobium tropiciagri]|uniref:hypothetical protein n=1 Tax=Bradyrhizobium tropiciagri TaxID=312253 RepID=UPI001009EDCD|nr:hypothetical protein [Bradyrhizobium tropiciagri]